MDIVRRKIFDVGQYLDLVNTTRQYEQGPFYFHRKQMEKNYLAIHLLTY